MKLRWLLLQCALIVFPLGNILRFDVGADIALLGLDIVVGLLLLSSLPLYTKDWRSLKKDPILMSGSAFIGIGLLSLLLKAPSIGPLQTAVAGLYSIRFIAYLNLLTVISRLSESRKTFLANRAALSVGAMFMLGIAQYMFYPDLRNLFYLGWDEHVHRLFGTLLDPNFTGAVFVLGGIGFAVPKLLYRKDASPIVIKSMIVSIGMLVTTILTYSRSTYLMLLSSAVSYGLFVKKYTLILTFVLSATIIGSVLVQDRSSENVNLFRTASIIGRTREYAQALDIIQESPIIGVGFNAYRYAQLHKGYVDLDAWTQDHAGAGVPNSYLFVMATTGLFGLLAYTILWTELLFSMHRSQHYIELAALSGLLIHGLFENTLFYPFVMFLAFMLVGIHRKSTTSSEAS